MLVSSYPVNIVTKSGTIRKSTDSLYRIWVQSTSYKKLFQSKIIWENICKAEFE